MNALQKIWQRLLWVNHHSVKLAWWKHFKNKIHLQNKCSLVAASQGHLRVSGSRPLGQCWCHLKSLTHGIGIQNMNTVSFRDKKLQGSLKLVRKYTDRQLEIPDTICHDHINFPVRDGASFNESTIYYYRFCYNFQGFKSHLQSISFYKKSLSS